MKKWMFFALAGMVLWSCQSDNGVERSVEEVTASIADNPISNKVNQSQQRKEKVKQETDPNKLAKMNFDNDEFDFGTVDEGEVVKHTFEFKNTGKVPLMISNAKGSCGCTVPDWPKEPIPVGAVGKIDVSFNSKGRVDAQAKTVTITANTNPSITTLKIKGMVTADPDKAQKPAAKPATDNKGGHSHDGHDHSGHDHSHDGHNH